MSSDPHDDGMPVEERIGHAIRRAEQAAMATKSRALRPSGLTVPQYAALLALSSAPGISGAELARRCFVTPQTMATLLTTLEQRGLVSREPSIVHAQVLVTRLTRAGQTRLRAADRAAVAVERELAAEFSGDEARQLSALLRRAAEALGRIAVDPRT